MAKTKKNDLSLGVIIGKVEALLGSEIESLPETLKEVTPDKRLDFISRTLPLVVKYRENHSSGGWDLPSW